MKRISSFKIQDFLYLKGIMPVSIREGGAAYYIRTPQFNKALEQYYTRVCFYTSNRIER